MNNNISQKGFTLIELLVAVAVLGIITGLAVPIIRNIQLAQVEKRYTTYLDSVSYSAKLYTDSYSNDLFGENTTGCRYVNYGELNRYKLLKDIDMRDISCNSDYTAVKVVKYGDQYYYKPFIGCGVEKNGKAANADIFRPSKVDVSSICISGSNKLISIEGEPPADDSLINKEYAPKVKIISETGVSRDNPPRIFYGYSYDQSPNVIGDWQKLEFKIATKKLQEKWIREGKTQVFSSSSALPTPRDVTGDLYLVIRVDLLEDLSGYPWQTSEDNYVYLGPYRVDNEAPNFNDSTIVSSAGSSYQSKKPKLNFHVTDEHFSAESDLKICYSYDTEQKCPVPTSHTDLVKMTEYKNYNARQILKGISNKYDGTKHTIHVTVADAAGNYSQKDFEYTVSNSYKLTFDPAGGSTCDHSYIYQIKNKAWTAMVVDEAGFNTKAFCKTTRTGYTLNGWYTQTQGKGTQVKTTDLAKSNLKVYANWKANTYKLTYSPSGLCNPGYKNVQYNSKYGTLCTPTRKGHTFIGWEDANGKAATANTIMGAKDTTIYANFRINSYKLTYSPSGLCNPGSKTLKYNEAYGTLCTPTMTGNTFTGWYTASSGGTKVSSSTKMEDHNTTIHARFVPKSYTLTFDPQGGTPCNPKTRTVKYGESYGTLCNTTKNGHTFTGWYTKPNGGSPVSSSTKMGASNTTIYAHWSANPVYITYLGNGADGGSTPKQTCYYNQTCTLSTNGFTYTGHSWTGWYPSAKGGTRFGDTVKLTADLKVYAQWELSKYKLSYDGNGHNSGSTADTECQYNVNCQLRSNGYDKIGHNFAGWYNAKTGGTPYGTYTKLKNNLTVYAHWNPKPYSVTYNGNTNTGGSTSPTTCNYNKPCTLATNGFSKTGHSWNGWWTAAGGGTRYPASVTITGNITAYAHWKKNSYTLTYVPSGLCNPGSKTLEYDEAYGTLCTPTMTGYTFTGWYTAETGGTRVGSNNKMGASNTKIYAHLSVNPVTVTYKGNGNTGGSMTNQTCYYNQNCTLKTNGFTNTGKSWTGWYSSATGGTKFGATVKLTGNLTVYAQWKANNYTLTYSPSGLCNPGSKTVAFGSTYGTLCAPTQTGYTFGGWWTAATGGTQVTANTKMTTEGATIYAHKQTVSYSISYALNGGSVSGNPTTYNVETNAFTLKNPSRTGYIFDGWSGTGISGKSKSVTIPKGSTGNRSYTAHWLSDKITLKIKLYSGDKIKSETTTGGTTNKWSKNSSGYLLQNGSIYTATFPRSTASKFNPANHRNHHFIFLTKNGYGADYHKAWICDSGCKGTVYFSDGPMTINTYNIIADDNIEGNIVLRVNWRTAKSIVMYNINGGTVLNLPAGYYVDADGWIYNDVKGGPYDDIGSPYLHTLNSNEALSQNGVINYGWPTFINIAPPPGKTGPDHASAWARMDHNSIYTCKRTTYSEASNTGYTGSSFCDTTSDGDCICRLKVNW